MWRALTGGVAVAVAAVVAACGSGSSSSTNSSTSAAPPAGSGKTVSVKNVSGIGNVLVDRQGRALYSSVQEASGKVLCTGACTSIWKPLTPGRGAPTGAASAGRLAVITRSDGMKQVTVNGKPLYTFAQDSAGKVTGNGVADIFGNQPFSWHAMLAGGKPAKSTAGTPSGGVPGY